MITSITSITVKVRRRVDACIAKRRSNASRAVCLQEWAPEEDGGADVAAAVAASSHAAPSTAAGEGASGGAGDEPVEGPDGGTPEAAVGAEPLMSLLTPAASAPRAVTC